MKSKIVQERDTNDLLVLTFELCGRAAMQPNNKDMHDAYVEARTELEKRIAQFQHPPAKEVSKYPIGGYAPGNYMCNCTTCKADFFGDKLAVQCEPCAVKMIHPVPDEAVQKHLLKIMDMTADGFIKTHIEKMYGGLQMASVQYFLESGSVSGSLYTNLKDMMIQFAKNWHTTAAVSPAPPSGEDAGKGWISVGTGCKLPVIPPPYKEDGCTLTPMSVPILCHQDDSVVLDWYDDSGIMWFELKEYTHWMPLPLPPQ